MCLICFLYHIYWFILSCMLTTMIFSAMITKINTINDFVFFFLNENLNIVFLHQEGPVSKGGGGGHNQN